MSLTLGEHFYARQNEHSELTWRARSSWQERSLREGVTNVRKRGVKPLFTVCSLHVRYHKF